MQATVSRATIARRGASAAILGSAANVAVFATATGAGIELTVAAGAATRSVTAGEVVVSSLVPVVAGVALAVALREPKWLRRLRVVVVAVTLASLGGPLTMGVGIGTKLALAAMHLIAAIAFLRVITTGDASRQRRLVDGLHRARGPVPAA